MQNNRSIPTTACLVLAIFFLALGSPSYAGDESNALEQGLFLQSKSLIVERLRSLYPELADPVSAKTHGEIKGRLQVVEKALSSFQLTDYNRIQKVFRFEGPGAVGLSNEQRVFGVFAAFFALWLWGEENANFTEKNVTTRQLFDVRYFWEIEKEFEENGVEFSEEQLEKLWELSRSQERSSQMLVSRKGEEYLVVHTRNRRFRAYHSVPVTNRVESGEYEPSIFSSFFNGGSFRSHCRDHICPFDISVRVHLDPSDSSSWTAFLNAMIHEVSHGVGLLRSSQNILLDLPGNPSQAAQLAKATIQSLDLHDLELSMHLLREGQVEAIHEFYGSQKYILRKTPSGFSLAGPFRIYWETATALAVQNFALPARVYPDSAKKQLEPAFSTRVPTEYGKAVTDEEEVREQEYLDYYLCPLLFKGAWGDRDRALALMRSRSRELDSLLGNDLLVRLSSAFSLPENWKETSEALFSSLESLRGPKDAESLRIRALLTDRLEQIEEKGANVIAVPEAVKELKRELLDILEKEYGDVLPKDYY